MLMTPDGTYTNAVYGFLSILFKELDEINPYYIAIAFDLKAPTYRHKMYDGYKATRKGMPNELACQLPILKNILKQMNITTIEKEGYEADDILGTLSKIGEENGLDVTILSGDRDTFQLITDSVKVRIPRTKAGKTETEEFTKEKIKEVYDLEPMELIEVKGLMGDKSDNIPGIPGVGEKTALNIVKRYKTIENLYDEIEKGEDDLKGAVKNKIIENKDLAFLSKKLGTIDKNASLDYDLEELKVREWNKVEIISIFKELRFNRFIQRFNLENIKEIKNIDELFKVEKLTDQNLEIICEEIINEKQLYYYLDKKVNKISIFSLKNKIVYESNIVEKLKNILENEQIQKNSYSIKEDYILLKQMKIEEKNISFDVKIAAYLLNSSSNQYSIEEIANKFLNIDFEEYLSKINGKSENQMSLFSNYNEENINYENALKVYCIYKLKSILIEELEKQEELELFKTIEMPLVEVLAQMQYEGIYIDKEELISYGMELKAKVEELEQQIYEISECNFNINSPKQLGEVLFEKLKLPFYKKNKNGYATDVDTLQKLKSKHPVIEKILEYRQISKLNSTYVDGIIPYINKNTKRIHSNFHQTVTATGRISSTDPNMQNIPTRMEAGKNLRKVFKPREGYVFLDADYSQIELRIFAHMSCDEEMIKAFNSSEDIHKQAASKVFGVKLDEVTQELRTKAKAVNFGIVYGISDFGLAEQIGSSKAEAKQYIDQYLEKYSGIKKFMEEIPEKAKQTGYVETMFKRRRYIPELMSNNYTVRQFGIRAAMNTPIQGTAADIIKIAMIKVYNKLKEEKLESKLILQVHDELLIEVKENEIEKVKDILKNCMENVIKLSIPLKIDIKEGHNWFEAK